MRKQRLGLRAQFILLIVAGLSAMFAVVAVVVIRISTSNLRNGLINESKSFASLSAKPIGDTFATYQDSGVVKIVQQIDKFTSLDTDISNVGIVDIDGKLLYQQQQNAGNVTANQAEASSFEPVYSYQGNKLTRIVTPYIEDSGAHRYSVVYAVSYSAIDNTVKELANGIIGLAFMALLSSILVAYLLISRLFLKPLGQVSSAAIEISKGDLDRKIEPHHNDEIGDLAVSVNTMAEALMSDIRKLKETDAIKSEFMMITSHNLRTPLTVIQGYLEALQGNSDLPDAAKDLVAVLTASSSRLAAFAEDILTVSRIETGENVTTHREQTDLAQLLKGIAADFGILAKQKGIEFRSTIGDNACNVLISTPHIRGAVWNLLDNALKFTKEGSVALELSQSSNHATISVSDTGEGIAPDEIPKLFTKFHRGTSTLVYNYEGSGIGLYLTKLIIDQHGGIIEVSSKLGKGTTFTIKLPLSGPVQTTDNKPLPA